MVYSILVLIFCLVSVCDAVRCLKGSELIIKPGHIDKHIVDCEYGCAMYKRYSGDEQMDIFYEWTFACLVKELDINGECGKDVPSKGLKKLPVIPTLDVLKVLAPENNWADAWIAATGPLGAAHCTDEAETDSHVTELESLDHVNKCLVYENKKANISLYRFHPDPNKGTAACYTYLIYHKGSVRRLTVFASQPCDPTLSECGEYSNKQVIENELNEVLSEKDEQDHLHDNAVGCCCNIEPGKNSCTPQNPFDMICWKDDLVTVFQRGIDFCDEDTSEYKKKFHEQERSEL